MFWELRICQTKSVAKHVQELLLVCFLSKAALHLTLRYHLAQNITKIQEMHNLQCYFILNSILVKWFSIFQEGYSVPFCSSLKCLESNSPLKDLRGKTCYVILSRHSPSWAIWSREQLVTKHPWGNQEQIVKLLGQHSAAFLTLRNSYTFPLLIALVCRL